MKLVSVKVAATILETSTNVILVTACNYKKKHGVNYNWYKSDGIKSLVDIDYLIALRKKEIQQHQISCDLFYFITEEMNIKQWKLSEILTEKSELFKDKRSWNSFMQSYLFSEPVKKFSNGNSLRKEFHRIASKLKEEYNDRC